MTDINCPHCGKKIKLNIETEPPTSLLRVDVTKPKENKTMREPERIDRIIEKLRKAWKANPDLRLCQLVFNIATRRGSTYQDIFYVEDDIFEAILNQHVETSQ